MTEFLPQNNHGLNQTAKAKLLAAGEPVSPDSQYVVQVMLWGLENLPQAIVEEEK